MTSAAGQRFSRQALPRLAGLLFAGLLALTVYFGPITAIDERISDLVLRWQARERPAPASVVVIDIDQRSLEDPQMLELLGNWPWPRAAHGEIVDYLAHFQPKAILFDLIFSEPDVFRPYSDAHFAAALERFPALLPLVIAPDGAASALAGLDPVMGIESSALADAAAALPLIAPKALPPHVWRTGIINFLEDDDGIGRRYWLWYRHDGWAIPSLPARAALDAGLPLPDSDSLRLHWYAGPFERISYRDVYLDSLSEHPSLGARFNGRTVIIGTAAPGLHDLRPTPLSAITPGPQILATAIANLEHADYLSPVSPGYSLLLGLATMGLIGTAFHRQWHPAIGATTLLAIGLGTLAAAHTLLRHDLLWQPYSALAVAAAYYIAAGLWSYLQERRRREHTTQMFGRFLDPAIVATLSDEDQMAEASASSKREISVLFSDIRGFTTLSETRDPEEVVALLNRYFDRQVEAIFSKGGTLDKFIGDAIMAFWGAPVDRPDHAHAAVLAAMSMVEQLEAFKQELGDDLAQFDIGIGIHTGPAVVGFLGSKRRLDYTAIGDTVNLASRIEGETKGRARVLVSEATRNACDAFGECRLDFVDMGEVTVKGRHRPVRLYQPTWRQA